MIFRCHDFETTGLPTAEGEKHGIMEVGFCDLVDNRVGPVTGFLVNPGRPTSIEARAVHHISDADVADAMSPTDACMILMGQKGAPLTRETPEEKPDYFVAHNIDMERAFFGGGEVPWLCTYKCALRIWPNAVGHKLQELRYILDVDRNPDFNPEYASHPHRAPDDAYVLAFVLREMLAEAARQEIPIDKLVKYSSGPALLTMCFMKKHKGKLWSQVAREDPSYLDFIVNKSDITDRDIRATARYYLSLHQKSVPAPSNYQS